MSHFRPLKPEEAEKILGAINRAHAYFIRLQEVLDDRGYAYDHPYRVRIRRIVEDLYDFKVWTFYRTLTHGVSMSD